MTRATTTIPFHDLTFIEDLQTLSNIEERLKKFFRSAKRARRDRQGRKHEAGLIGEDELVTSYSLEKAAERSHIRRRAMRYDDRVAANTGMAHLSNESHARLTALRSGLPVTPVMSEHEAHAIAAAFHAEMRWTGQATEAVWHGFCTPARAGLPGVRFDPLVLVGSPGIGKRYWARQLAHDLAVPITKINATSKPVSFSVSGWQRGWGSVHPGKLVTTVLNEQHIGTLVIIDEIENAGDVHSERRSRHILIDALLP